MKRNAMLRSLCRTYLHRLEHMAMKHGLGSWLKDTIKETKDENCKPTEYEVQMLSRLVDDERIQRIDIPPMLGKNYKDCTYDDEFEKIKKLRPLGRYSKVSALLFAEEKKEKLKNS